MPKYRKLHTKIVESFDFNDMPNDFHRLMWVLLPLAASREGTLPAHPTLVLSKLFPLRQDLSGDDAQAALDWYEAHDMIRYYESGGRRYLWIVNFAEYQGTTTKEAESTYPPVPDSVSGRSGAGPEQVLSRSSTDSICNTQYSDADSNSQVDAATPEPEAAPQPPQPDLSPVYRAYENVFGVIASQAVADDIASLVEDMAGVGGKDGAECVLLGIAEAKDSSKGLPSLKYLKAILANWKRSGLPSSRASPGGNGNGHGPPAADMAMTLKTIDRLCQETADKWQQGSEKQGSTIK